jgi:hypothetical protein
MKTLIADDRRRIQIPDAKPGQIFAFINNGDETRTLTEVKAGAKEPFPPGSLLKCVDEWNKEFAPVAIAIQAPAPPKDWE